MPFKMVSAYFIASSRIRGNDRAHHDKRALLGDPQIQLSAFGLIVNVADIFENPRGWTVDYIFRPVPGIRKAQHQNVCQEELQRGRFRFRT